ncbi:MAG: NAD-dependent formate dehydrogenase [Candidatus Nitrosopolaris sp.]
MKIVAVLYPAGELAHKTPELLGCAENALGLMHLDLEGQGHEFVVLTDKESTLDKHLPTTDVLITTPFWPAYVTAKRISKAPKLKLILTAGIGSDHIDLSAAAAHKITVAEITGSNVVSVAEQAVMHILALVRNYMPAYKQVLDGRWDIGEIAARTHDLENKVVGIIGMGRIGQRVCERLKAFNVKMIYYDYHRLSTAEEFVFGACYATLERLVEQSDIITINTPLTPQTDNMFNRDLLFRMKKGTYLINTARGRIVNIPSLVEALEKGHLAGYAGDVWFPEPAPKDHPWRHMPNHAMVPHYSGTSLEAQRRYADGIKDCLLRFINQHPIEQDYLIVDNGTIVNPSYSYAFKTLLTEEDEIKKFLEEVIAEVEKSRKRK